MVQFDCEDPPLPVVPSLTNGVPPGHDPRGPSSITTSSSSARTRSTPNSNSPGQWQRRHLHAAGPTNGHRRIRCTRCRRRMTSTTRPTSRIRGRRRGCGRSHLSPVALTPGVWFLAIHRNSSRSITRSWSPRSTRRSSTSPTASPSPHRADRPQRRPTGADLQYYAFLVSSNSVRPIRDLRRDRRRQPVCPSRPADPDAV